MLFTEEQEKVAQMIASPDPSMRQLGLELERQQGIDIFPFWQALYHLSPPLLQTAQPPQTLEEKAALASFCDAVNVSFNHLPAPNLLYFLRFFNNLRELRLDDCGLTEFPRAVLLLTSLQLLSLDRNALEEIPNEIQRLSKLRVLSLRENRLRHLPESLSVLTDMHWIDLQHNALEDLPSQIGRLTKLQTLRLDGNPNLKLPASLVENTALMQLSLDWHTVYLPPELSNLSFFRSLRLAGKPLSSSFFHLTQLESLELNKGDLSVLPPEIERLQGLMRLTIQQTQLQRLPAELSRLPKLRILVVEQCLLEQIPVELGELPALELLRFNKNQLAEIPDSIGNLTKLRLLDLAHNQLERLPDSIGQLTQLYQLQLSSNRLSELPDLRPLRLLRNLALNHNRFATVPESIFELKQLEKLELKGNPLTKLPKEIARLQRLSSLELDWDRVELPVEIADCKAFTLLNIQENYEQLHPSFAHLQQLRVLCIASEKIREIVPQILALQQLEQLSFLHLSVEGHLRLLPYFPQLRSYGYHIYIFNNKWLESLNAKRKDIRALDIYRADFAEAVEFIVQSGIELHAVVVAWGQLRDHNPDVVRLLQLYHLRDIHCIVPEKGAFQAAGLKKYLRTNQNLHEYCLD